MSAATRRDAIERALIHHQLRRVVRFYSSPSVSRPTWRVQFDGEGTFDAHEFSTPQMLAVCETLAAVERQSESTR